MAERNPFTVEEREIFQKMPFERKRKVRKLIRNGFDPGLAIAIVNTRPWK